ncbi:MAG: hypothetical protein JO347_02460, partial [Candidatus Eremiobacteraeota bacterium]|nr:hypothetical protein [Candidatus Eremiobacteraeota bacterium]
MRPYSILAAVALALPASVAPALADVYTVTTPAQDQWQTTVTPYLWVPTIHGELNFNVPTTMPGQPQQSVGITATPSQYIPKLGSGFMFIGETRNSRWGLGTDLIYLNLGVSNAGVTNITGPGGRLTIPINTNVQVRFTSTLWTIYGIAPVVQTPRWSADGIVGGRYVYAPMRLTWNVAGPLGLFNPSGQQYASTSVWDAIVGAKGRVSFGDGKWFIPYYADVGTGEAHLTWQAIGGFGYGFKHGQSAALV